MSDTEWMRALRDLPRMDLPPARAAAILSRAEAVLAPARTRPESWIAAAWSRWLAPALVGSTVAGYLVWALSAASALYR